MQINPTHLVTFALVARCQSVTRAAEILALGQPAVSGQLKQLQDAVGEALYERRAHQLALTPAGAGLLDYAESLERTLREAEEYARRLQSVNAGTLRIGSTTTISSYYLPRYIVQLQTRYPGVHVYMTTGNTQEIASGLAGLDLAFVEGPVPAEELPPKYQLLPWRDDEIVLIVHQDHEIAQKYPDGVPLEVFTRYQVIWREAGSGAREVVEQALERAGVIAPVNIEVTGVAGVKESVRAGLGIGFASSRALRYENEGLVARRINPPQGLIWNLNIIAPEQRMQSRTAQAFLALCREIPE